MDTSDRPRKRMRLTSNVLGKSTSAMQFLQQFGFINMHEHRDTKYESMVSEMLLNLEASASIEMPTARKLHKIFIVNIGFSLKLKRMDHTLLLAKCLLALYRSIWSYLKDYGLKSAENYFGIQEIEEAFVVILQGLEGLKGNPSRVNTSVAISLRFICLQIIYQLILMSPLIREIVRERAILEAIFYVIVSMPKCSTTKSSLSTSNEASFNGILSILRSLSPTAMHLGTLVDCIVSGNHRRVLDATPTSKDDQIFYIKCLVISGAPEKCMEDSRLHEAISFTEHTYLGEHHLLSAVDCFCLMVENWNMSVDLKEFFEFIVKVLLERPKTNDVSPRVSVECFKILTEKSSTRGMLLESREYDSVIQFLLDVVFDEIEREDTERQASDVLCSLALALHDKSRAHKESEQSDPYRLLSCLLSSDNRAVLCKAVSSIHVLLKASEPRIKHNCCCKLISLLAEASLRGFVSKAMQHEVIDIFQLLVKKNDTFLNFLTRQPISVSLIVHAAFAENCNLRRKAFALLFQMSKYACNHRIMARQPGLLSAFFRYARSVSNTDDQREKAKECILSLAKAL